MRIEGGSVVVLLAALVLAACPGELPNKAEFEAYAVSHPEAGAPAGDAGKNGGSSGAAAAGSAGVASMGACGDVPARILVKSCGGTGCHGSMAPQQDLDLVSAGVEARVRGVSGKQCLQLLADPAHPEQSLIYQKLFPKPPCGVQMPLAKPALSSADQACVLAWLASLAAPTP